MFKEILIISDNFYLSQKFEEILNSIDYEGNYFFGISPFSNLDDFNELKTSNLRTLNLKSSQDIDYIKSKFDLIFSLHCKQFFPPTIVDYIKCINIHPGYNPINRGWYPQVFAIIHDLQIGATIHEIDNQLDHGKIIDRVLISKDKWDTSLDIYNKVLEGELNIIKKNLSSIINNSYQSKRPEKNGRLYLKSDFEKLLELDLSKKTTYGDVIDHLRALTHGDYKNAYFFDKETGKKVYVSLNLEIDDKN
ncbi:dTDP-4-amino-4,6-dideoxyglucose formyltransferase [Salegentibacter sp. T436]|uniref:dTDP-4-amino-4,6-dideoxyglucose formyltransferase n=1 Tax=Salegentibacter sp. T436 TaxID=1729720 RepID=UPI00094A4D7A|nr:dTDP-4-amino-4,6-dideoxyglucose formyltransferase [Salegentibacter sp. T436]APS39305.1 hypothetical protein AO058_10660 [Salegentibacter sp. T436]